MASISLSASCLQTPCEQATALGRHGSRRCDPSNCETEEALPSVCFCWVAGHSIRRSDECQEERRKRWGWGTRCCPAALQWNRFLYSLKEPCAETGGSFATPTRKPRLIQLGERLQNARSSSLVPLTLLSHSSFPRPPVL